MAFEDKFKVHDYKEEILQKFDENIPLVKIQKWLKDLGKEFELSTDTLKRHKQKYLENKSVADEIKKAQEEFGECNQLETYLLETIAQCRAKKNLKTISGKDFQYYDQQMQSAIKLLRDIRNSDEKSLGIDEVFTKMLSDIQQDKLNKEK